jgi:hypothetical protein
VIKFSVNQNSHFVSYKPLVSYTKLAQIVHLFKSPIHIMYVVGVIVLGICTSSVIAMEASKNQPLRRKSEEILLRKYMKDPRKLTVSKAQRSFRSAGSGYEPFDSTAGNTGWYYRNDFLSTTSCENAPVATQFGIALGMCFISDAPISPEGNSLFYSCNGSK